MRLPPLATMRRAAPPPPSPAPAAAPRPDAPPGAEHTAADPIGAMPPWRLWALGFGVCTLLGLIVAAEEHVSSTLDGRPVPLPWGSVLAEGLGLWSLWAVVWVLVDVAARRWPLGQQPWRLRLALYTAAGFAIAGLKLVWDYPWICGFYCPHPETLTFGKFLLMGFADVFAEYIVIYWTMVGVSHALGYYGKYREREVQAARLETDLARARLGLLKSQLHPHFLFNTLNAISALVHTDPEAADRMVARLGDLLRLALDDFDVQEAPLSRELEAVRAYLEIEQARLGPRLRVRLDVAPDAAGACVPTFLLQTLVENAVRHGVAPRSTPGHVQVRAWREDDRLRLEVRDDGPGLPPEPRGGVGLANTRARLIHLYGPRQRLEVCNDPRGGCVAGITLPYREDGGQFGEDGNGSDDQNADRG